MEIHTKVYFEQDAVKHVLKFLRFNNGYTFDRLEHTNKGRYTIVFSKIHNIAITFKTEWFLKFGRMGFVSSDGRYETGIGDTLNYDDIKKFIRCGVKYVYIVYIGGQIYKIPLKDFIAKSHRWIVKEGKPVRSISIHHYERVNPTKGTQQVLNISNTFNNQNSL